jgi:hypothetical protein
VSERTTHGGRAIFGAIYATCRMARRLPHQEGGGPLQCEEYLPFVD